MHGLTSLSSFSRQRQSPQAVWNRRPALARDQALLGSEVSAAISAMLSFVVVKSCQGLNRQCAERMLELVPSSGSWHSTSRPLPRGLQAGG